jgi:GT2 family glycosyltransferase
MQKQQQTQTQPAGPSAPNEMPASVNGRTSVAVVIVNFNTCALLRDCLHSLQAAAAEVAWIDLRIVVVENASGDGSAAMVRAEFPSVELHALEANVGYTRGNNLALRALALLPGEQPTGSAQPPDFVWLLNPDTRVEPGALGALVRFLQGMPEAAACGPRLLYGDGTLQHGAFGWPGVAQVALDLLPLQRLPGAHRLYGGRLNGRYPRTLWEGATPFEVDFVLGAAMMVRGDDLRRLGGLDEGYAPARPAGSSTQCPRRRSSTWKGRAAGRFAGRRRCSSGAAACAFMAAIAPTSAPRQSCWFVLCCA